MTFFERIHINGFRRLADVDLELKPLNVVIGANGSGKTSLLDVFSLLAASASGRLKTTLSELRRDRGGLRGHALHWLPYPRCQSAFNSSRW